MNIKLLLALVPVLCTSALGSLLRYPDHLTLASTSETAETHRFIQIPSPLPDAFSVAPPLSDEVVSFSDPFPALTTDIDFGSIDFASSAAQSFDPGPLDAFLRNLDLSEPLFLLIGICLLSAGLRIPLPSPHPGRYRPQFSSQSPQIIQLTRHRRLP